MAVKVQKSFANGTLVMKKMIRNGINICFCNLLRNTIRKNTKKEIRSRELHIPLILEILDSGSYLYPGRRVGTVCYAATVV